MARGLEVDGGSQPINELDIEGYRLKLKMPLGIGNDLGDAEGTPEAKQLAIVLEAQIAGLRQGLGNLINLGTVNDLDENGEVDTAGDNYYTIQQLVETALSATGFEYEGAPAGINSDVTGTPIDAPGPLLALSMSLRRFSGASVGHWSSSTMGLSHHGRCFVLASRSRSPQRSKRSPSPMSLRARQPSRAARSSSQAGPHARQPSPNAPSKTWSS